MERGALAALNLIVLALLLLAARAWSQHGQRGRLVLSGIISVLAVTLAYVATVRPGDITADWISIVSHGLEGKSVMHLYVRGLYVGPNFTFVVSSVATGAVPNLHDVVWLNLLLALVNAALFFHIAVHITGVRWAIPWTLVFALNPATFLASFSELPTNLLGLYFLAGVVGWAVLNDPLPQPRIVRARAYALVTGVTLLAALTRIEVALIGLVALGLYTGHALLGSDTWSSSARRLRAVCERPLTFLDDHPALVVLLSFAGVLLSIAGLPWGLGRSESSALYPFNASIVALYIFLPMLLLPIGVSLATLLGSVHAVVHFRRFGGLALSLLVLVRMYFAAQYEYFEMGRYLSYVLPAIFLVGLFAKDQFDELARHWSPNWRRAARVGYLVTWFTRPMPGIPEFYTRPEYHLSGGFSQLLLDRNTQQEVRYLITLTEKNPQCVFVARVLDVHSDLKRTPAYDYVAFGVPVTDPIMVPEQDATLDEVIARSAAGASCVRLYYGGDCGLNLGDGCNAFIAGRRQLEEHRFWSRPYNNIRESGYAAPEVVLRTYDWP